MAFDKFSSGTTAVADEVNQVTEIGRRKSLNSIRNIINSLNIIGQTKKYQIADARSSVREGHQYEMGCMFSEDIAPTSTNCTFHEDEAEYVVLPSLAYDLRTPIYKTSATTNKCYAAFDYEIWTEYDEFEDAAVAGGLWTTAGTVAEAGGLLTVGGSGGGDTAETNDLSSYGVIRFGFQLYSDVGEAGSDAVVEYYDGNAHASLIIADGDGDDLISKIGEITMYNDWTNKKLYVTYSVLCAHSIAGTSNNAQGRYDKVFDLAGATSLKVRFRTGTDTGSRSRARYLRLGNEDPSTTVQFAVSADGGSNFDSIDEYSHADIANTGTEIQGKVSGTTAAGEVLVIRSGRAGFLG